MKQKQFRSDLFKKRINKLIVELGKMNIILEEYENNRNNKLPRCERCNIRNVRVRKNLSYFCNSCGYDSEEQKE